jgi:hydrogenase nickel incorporation protein HypA/HybF
VHELSIVHGVITAVSEAAESAGAQRVKSVTLRVGALAGVVEDALQFSFDIARQGSLLDGATLVVHRLPVIIHCATCGCEHELPGIQRFRCPSCDTPSADIRQGRELEIESIEIEVNGDNADR